tara:strand:+ start:8905 stop:9315 length:411 start_codon:yes stop_codon:yes gene_type:complete
MELNIRRLTDNDWETLVSWWDAWPEWANPPRDFLPENGKGGFMVEKNDKPVVAGFIYQTNSKGILLEWIISNPDYKDNDRKQAIELLILGAENVAKELGFKYMFSIGRSKSLINIHKEMGWTVDEKPSYEITKKIN